MNAIRIAFAIVLLIPSNVAVGQENSPSPPPAAADKVSADTIDQLRKSLEGAELDEEVKGRIEELLGGAAESLKKADEFSTQAGGFQSAADSAKTRAADLKTKLESLSNAAVPPVDQSKSLAELEQQLDQARDDVDKLKQSNSELEALIANRTARRKRIRERLTEIELQLKDRQRQLDQPPPDGQVAAVTRARRVQIRAELQRLRAESPALDSELAAYDAEAAADLVQLSRDDIAKRLNMGQQQVDQLGQVVQSRRELEASKQVTSAAEEAESETDPRLQAIAKRNVELAQQFQEGTKQLRKAEARRDQANATRDYWEETAEGAVEKVNAIGLTDTIGAMLRQQKATLPNSRRYRLRIDRRVIEIGDAQLNLLNLEDERSNQKELIKSFEQDEPARERAAELIATQSEQLAELVRLQRSYFDALVELSNTEQQIINETSAHAQFINERILWIRSGPPLYKSFSLGADQWWVPDQQRWSDAFAAIKADVFAAPLWYLVGILLLFLLLYKARSIRREIRAIGATVESGACVDLSPTVRAVSLTILASLPLPALVAFLAWRFWQLPTDNPVVLGLAQGFSVLATVGLPLEFFRQLCQPKGLAESHFSWPNQAVAVVRRGLRWLMVFGLPLITISAMLDADSTHAEVDTWQRLTFVAAAIVTSIFVSRVLNQRTGIFAIYLARKPHGWAAQLQPIWYWAGVLVPLAFGLLAIMGYSYTAWRLARHLHVTNVLLAVLAVVTAFFTRMLLVQRRRINIEAARKRRELASESDEMSIEAAEIPTADDLRAQITQSRSLLRMVMVGVAIVGLWMTWVDVLPALGFLEQRPLWRSIKTVSEMNTDAAGNVSYQSFDVLDPVTVSDLVFAVLVAIATVIAAKNIPGVLEISFLQRLPIDASVRYAITTVVSYIIILVGLAVGCSAIGIHWKQVQWMAAALTFGLAFGLQEMFANFVAGIIILFERPVRVGDIVTVDDVTGKVSRVQIRATTITNWDRKDYLVPNKDFITGRVLNWTLSNKVNRIVIPVGVAYGSDKDETVRQMLRVAIEHPQIVEDPVPTVTFEEFADSSLNYVLRCYIALEDMSSRLQIIHELYTGIDDAFRQANIEIPFPQQDLHLRSVDPDAKLN